MKFSLQLSIALTLVFASTSMAEIIGSTYNFAAAATGGTAIAATPGTTFTDPANPGFCVGPPVACGSGAGLSGSFAFTNVSPTEDHITFTFFGSTDPVGGAFTIDLSDFVTTDGSSILGITYVGGNLHAGDFSNVVWDSGTGDATFTGTSGGGYAAIGGVNVVFDVTEAAPEPASFFLGGLGLAGVAIAGIRRKRHA